MNPSLILLIVFLLLQGITVFLVFPALKRAAKTYRPMLFFLLGTVLLEMIPTFIPGKAIFFVSTTNFQYLLALLLILWQAKQWNVFDRKPWLFWCWLIAGIAGWIAEFMVSEPIKSHISLYYTGCSITVVIMAIEMLNRNLLRNSLPFHRNSGLLFSCGLILSFTLWALLDLFSASILDVNQLSLEESYYFYISIGILTQLLYIRSVMCIPAKERFIY